MPEPEFLAAVKRARHQEALDAHSRIVAVLAGADLVSHPQVYNDLRTLAEALPLPSPPPPLTRHQEAFFNVLNEEFDLSVHDFRKLWPSLEALLAAFGLTSTPIVSEEPRG